MAKDSALTKSFREVTKNPPRVLEGTRRKFGKARAEKQRVAIALSKARKAGARISQRKLVS